MKPPEDENPSGLYCNKLNNDTYYCDPTNPDYKACSSDCKPATKGDGAHLVGILMRTDVNRAILLRGSRQLLLGPSQYGLYENQ